MIVDVVTFNGEYDIWDIHYNALKGYVDQFIVVEFDETFSGRPRYPAFDEVRSYFPKATWCPIGKEQYEKYQELAELSENTIGADHWKREFMQKESIKDALTHLDDDDIVFVGDVDEIWAVSALKLMFPVKLKLDVYTYYINNRSSEQFWGTTVAPYHIIKNTCLNHLRTLAPKSRDTHGWHFTSMAAGLEKKLKDSYTQEDYAHPLIIENIAYNIENDKDFLGRDFTYRVDETAWPGYLKQNREKYLHLLREQG